MDEWVYRKTERGVLAFKERSSVLTAPLRSLLIMIDGTKTVGDLKRFGAVMGDVPTSLQMLADEGLIDLVAQAPRRVAAAPTSVASSAPVAPASAGVAPAPSPDASKLSLVEFQRQAVKVLLNGIGPMADPVCARIERAKNTPDALQAAQLGLTLLAESRRMEALQKLQALMERVV